MNLEYILKKIILKLLNIIKNQLKMDLKEAFYWYNKAVANEYEGIYINLARCYENGIGVRKDEVKAFELYKIMAENEFSFAQNHLAILYEKDIKSVKNAAQSKLGYLYENGIGTKKDLEKAFYW